MAAVKIGRAVELLGGEDEDDDSDDRYVNIEVDF